jgi:hypothetical protein
MNTIRICGLSKRSKTNFSPWLHRFGHYFFAGGDLTLTDGRSALGAEIIENLAIGQN